MTDVRDVPTPELIARAEAGDEVAAAELDRRGVEPPMLELDDIGIPAPRKRRRRLRRSHDEVMSDRWDSETEGGVEVLDPKFLGEVSMEPGPLVVPRGRQAPRS